MIFIDLTKAFDTILIKRNMQYREASLQLTYIFGVILCESEWMWLQMAGHSSWWQLHTQSTKTAAVEHLLFATARIWCWKKNYFTENFEWEREFFSFPHSYCLFINLVFKLSILIRNGIITLSTVRNFWLYLKSYILKFFTLVE